MIYKAIDKNSREEMTSLFTSAFNSSEEENEAARGGPFRLRNDGKCLFVRVRKGNATTILGRYHALADNQHIGGTGNSAGQD